MLAVCFDFYQLDTLYKLVKLADIDQRNTYEVYHLRVL
jgi:hypothetical protein